MKLRTLTLLLLLSIFTIDVDAQNSESANRYNILLTGASFASPNNTWFEQGCKILNATPINRAVGAQAITDTANKMADGTLYSPEELEEMDAFVIMQVHNKDVFDESKLENSYEEYDLPFEKRDNYSGAFDYVIKKYISECYNLRNNPKSKYYNTRTGKPAVIVLCTDWHDGRIMYNTSIRKLAEKWGLPLVEFDKQIGFTKNTLHPVTKEQYSLIYSPDTQIIEDVKYGWHPIDGEDSYIQKRMAAIFANLMVEILPQ